ncbi:MAG: hypothetical protein ACT4NY_33150 [Pseudonocardiales bacterium]
MRTFDDPEARALITELYADQLTRYDRTDPPDDDPAIMPRPRGSSCCSVSTTSALTSVAS